MLCSSGPNSITTAKSSAGLQRSSRSSPWRCLFWRQLPLTFCANRLELSATILMSALPPKAAHSIVASQAIIHTFNFQHIARSRYPHRGGLANFAPPTPRLDHPKSSALAARAEAACSVPIMSGVETLSALLMLLYRIPTWTILPASIGCSGFVCIGQHRYT